MRKIPYDIFQRELPDAAKRLDKIYHVGQERIWDGRKVLSQLLEKHGGVQIAEKHREALKSIFAVILWGELAALEISAELTLEIEDIQPKMAAASQTHDEIRHLTVMREYLTHLNYIPDPLHPAAERLLTKIMNANSLEKKLLGMQLMVEPVAIAIFQSVRHHNLEPVLCDLLPYYEMDESRHIALGINYLPVLVKKMNAFQLLELWAWQIQLLFLQVDELKALEPDLKVLGVDPLELFERVEKKQLEGMREFFLQAGFNEKLLDWMRSLVYYKRKRAFGI